MNQKKEKDETNGYRNTNGKESDDIEEPGTRGSRMSIIGHDGIRLVWTSRNQCKNLLLPSAAGTGKLATENCVVLLSTKNISDNIEIFSVDERIKPAVFYLSERSRRQCCSLFDHQHRTSKRHWCQRISDEHLPHRRKTAAAEIRIKQPPEMSLVLERRFFGG